MKFHFTPEAAAALTHLADFKSRGVLLANRSPVDVLAEDEKTWGFSSPYRLLLNEHGANTAVVLCPGEVGAWAWLGGHVTLFGVLLDADTVRVDVVRAGIAGFVAAFDPVAALEGLGCEVRFFGPRPVTGYGSRTTRKGYVTMHANVRDEGRLVASFDGSGPSEEVARESITSQLHDHVLAEVARRRRALADASRDAIRAHASLNDALAAVSSAQVAPCPVDPTKTDGAS